ncbi:MAG TPA: VanZ family protein [Candidatus Limnocylindria bacterium]|jgi:glycopeptide antibiotics resistance protein
MIRLISAVFLVGWLLGVFAFTLRPANPLPGQTVTDNLIPFVTVGVYLDNLDSAFWVSQAFGNLLLLLPVGLFGPIALPWLSRWWRVMLVAATISASIELAQLFIPERSADVDDVMFNTVGALLGYWLLLLLRAIGGVSPASSVGRPD